MSKDQFNFSADANSEKEVERYSPTALMFKNRVIIVAGEVNDQLAINVIAQIKHLEVSAKAQGLEGDDAKITLLVNSPGGSVISGMAMFDVIRQCSCPIETVGIGMQASMGSIMLASGDKRYMAPSATLMIHQIMSGNAGGTQASNLEISLAYTTQLHEMLKSVYVEFTGLTHDYWDLVMERDTFLTAEQALKIGFIDDITKASKPGGKYASEAKRPAKVDAITAAAHKAIAGMSKDDVIKALNNGQANNGEWGRYRPELVVRLAEFAEYWTPARRAEAGLAASNDDKKTVTTRGGRKAAGPSA